MRACLRAYNTESPSRHFTTSLGCRGQNRCTGKEILKLNFLPTYLHCGKSRPIMSPVCPNLYQQSGDVLSNSAIFKSDKKLRIRHI